MMIGIREHVSVNIEPIFLLPTALIAAHTSLCRNLRLQGRTIIGSETVNGLCVMFLDGRSSGEYAMCLEPRMVIY